jgi:uncharacterized protein YndB with AHSA1/START domain
MDTVQKQKLKGFIAPNVFAVTSMAITRYFINDDAGQLIASEFLIIPIMMGIICAWFWRDIDLLRMKRILYSCSNVFITIGLSYIFLQEGVICLIIVSPLIFCFVLIGISIGRAMFRRNNNTLNVSILAALLALFTLDALSNHAYENKVSDTIIINAPPNKVWRNVVAFKKIKQKNTFWLFLIGLPSPAETTVDGYYKGAGRKCIFSNGYVFDERVSTYEPGKDLVFDIVNQPRDPEIMNHLDLLRGEFLLKDNGNGTTTLTGNSWYKLYVFPTWYYDLWAQSIVRNVYLRVMEHIKEISEFNR